MKESIRNKLNALQKSFDELNQALLDPEIFNDQNKLRSTTQERSHLEPITTAWQHFQQSEVDLQEAIELANEDSDADVQQMAHEECVTLRTQLERLQEEINVLLLPKDPHDDSNLFLEIRAGTGGNEAALFVGDLLRMYQRYTEKQGWRIETLSLSEGEVGGYKEVITRIIGHGAYSHLKFESGAHRVQRVPETESQGRVHTSACTVAVIPEPSEAEVPEIENKDLRIDTFRASGAGGQHVNKTDSAIRITHLPTGMVVECQQERSQHQNKARALAILQARLLDAEQTKLVAEQSAQRKSLVGTGDRSDRIRTYNFPQGRITDHRIHLSEYKLMQCLEGDLEIIIDPLIREHQAELMASTE